VTQKGTSLRGTASFNVFCIKICAGVLAVGDWKTPKNEQNSRVTLGCGKSRMRRNENPKPMWIECCRMTEIRDIITYATFGDDWFKGLRVMGGQIFAIPH